MRDLHVEELVIGSDSHETTEAINSPVQWPQYRCLLQTITLTMTNFALVDFESESAKSNHVARDIAKSVLRGARFQSYLSFGGPAWLDDRIRSDFPINNS